MRIEGLQGDGERRKREGSGGQQYTQCKKKRCEIGAGRDGLRRGEGREGGGWAWWMHR